MKLKYASHKDKIERALQNDKNALYMTEKIWLYAMHKQSDVEVQN